MRGRLRGCEMVLETEKKLSQLFNNRLFRIPDYQRGYSWTDDQLLDLWEDITNLDNNQNHYTGMITLEKAETEIKWTGCDTFKVVDGQQRLTSLVILLKVLVERAEKLKLNEISEIPLNTIKEKYLFLTNGNNPTLKCAILGYLDDELNDTFFSYSILVIK